MENKPKVSKLPGWSISFISGGIAGTFAKTAIAPLERVKILFQIRSTHYPFTGIFPTIVNITKREGFLSLWKGNTAVIIRIFPYAAIQFMTYEKYKAMLLSFSYNNITNQQTLATPLVNLIGGSMAGATAVIFTYPLDLVRVRFAVAVENNQYRGVWHALKVISRNEGGVRALYKGIGPTIMGIAPYAGMNFASFEFLKSIAPKKKGSKDPPVTVKLICGALAGAVGQTVAYPLDVVRRQMQTQGIPGGHNIVHKNTWQALVTITNKDGFSGLFRGLSINYLKVMPQVAISFTTYEFVKEYLGGWT